MEDEPQEPVDAGETLARVFRQLNGFADLRSLDPGERARAVYRVTGDVQRANAVYDGLPDPLIEN
jgi:hypothetical protein